MENIRRPLRQPVLVSAQHLDSDHHETFVRAIGHVLSTELAETTMAQLIDGLPLDEVVWNMRGNLLVSGHPLTSHTSLCQGALEQARLFRAAFDPAILSFEASVVQAYQDAAPYSHAFKMRLVELVASSIHQIAVLLFNYEPKLHDGNIESVVSWKKESKWVVNPDGFRLWQEALYDPYPTLFFHCDYEQHELYPNGLAEVAGYWAEDQIFGGVVLFDRGESGVESHGVYFQPGRKNTTFRIWQPLETQFNAMVDFLLADTSQQTPPPSPFPLMASDENRHRYDPWIAMDHHVYRDAWERDLPPRQDTMSWRDCISTGDYPELEDQFRKIEAAAEGPYLDSDAEIPSAPPSPFLDPDLALRYADILNSPEEVLDNATQSQLNWEAAGGDTDGVADDEDDNKESLSELTSANERTEKRSSATVSDAGHKDTANAGQGGTVGDNQAKSISEGKLDSKTAQEASRGAENEDVTATHQKDGGSYQKQ